MSWKPFCITVFGCLKPHHPRLTALHNHCDRFKNPRWVEGELLQFSSNNPMTRGAEMGFVWAVPGEKRFLILLNHIDLSELERRSYD